MEEHFKHKALLDYYKRRIKERKQLQDIARHASIHTWDRINFTLEEGKKSNLTLNENSLTENLAITIAKNTTNINGKRNLQIEQSRDESTNGNDLLLCIKFEQGYLVIPIQAKLLKNRGSRIDGSYYNMTHKNSKGQQFNLLNNYAKKLKTNIAFYLFYNCVDHSKWTEDTYYYYGCSLASTTSLQKLFKTKTNFRFSTIHPLIGKPFYQLFGAAIPTQSSSKPKQPEPSPSGPNSPNQSFKEFCDRMSISMTEKQMNKVKFYSEKELLSDSTWFSKFDISPIPPKKIKPNPKQFNPKYRIVFESGNTELITVLKKKIIPNIITNKKTGNIKTNVGQQSTLEIPKSGYRNLGGPLHDKLVNQNEASRTTGTNQNKTRGTKLLGDLKVKKYGR
jgi:hypothetical protein